MQGRVDKGEFNSATTRVLHYVLNPEAEARKEQQHAKISELEAEVAVLKSQLGKIGSTAPPAPEVSEAQTAGNQPRIPVMQAELLVLQQKVYCTEGMVHESTESGKM